MMGLHMNQREANLVATPAAELPMACIDNFSKALRKKKNTSASKPYSNVSQKLRSTTCGKFRVYVNQQPNRPVPSFGLLVAPRDVAPHHAASGYSQQSRHNSKQVFFVRPPQCQLLLSRLQKNTKNNDILKYVRYGTAAACKCAKLVSKYGIYTSYKITVA